MDAVVKVQLKHEREHSAQEYVEQLRTGLAQDPSFSDLEFAFDAGGMIRSAMNEGKSSPINIRLSAKNLPQARAIAEIDQTRDRPDRRRGRRPDHPAARLPGIHHRRRPCQGGRPQAEPDRGHEKRGGGAQLEHPVSQEELLDRPGEQESVLRRRPVFRGRHRLGRDAARRADHRVRPGQADPAAEYRHPAQVDRAHGNHPQQSAVDDRSDDGRLGPRPGSRGRRRGPRGRPLRRAPAGWVVDSLRSPTIIPPTAR